MLQTSERFGRSGLREFLGSLGMEEHADTMAAEGVSSLEDLKLVSDQSDLEALGKPRHANNVVHDGHDAQSFRGLEDNICRVLSIEMVLTPQMGARRRGEGDAPDQAPQGLSLIHI